MSEVRRRGLCVILSSPSGAGKSTISRLLLDRFAPTLQLSTSVTTRGKRPSEVDGVHYHFITPARFERMQAAGELLEWAEVHGNHYGTPREPVEEALAAGRDVLFDIDWQGAAQIGRAMPDDVVSVFILPPSAAELRARLVRRAEDDEATIARRLANAREELGHFAEYGYVVVNDELERALDGVTAVVAAERLRRERREGLSRFVAEIASGL